MRRELSLDALCRRVLKVREAGAGMRRGNGRQRQRMAGGVYAEMVHPLQLVGGCLLLLLLMDRQTMLGGERVRRRRLGGERTGRRQVSGVVAGTGTARAAAVAAERVLPLVKLHLLLLMLLVQEMLLQGGLERTGRGHERNGCWRRDGRRRRELRTELAEMVHVWRQTEPSRRH